MSITNSSNSLPSGTCNIGAINDPGAGNLSFTSASALNNITANSFILSGTNSGNTQTQAYTTTTTAGNFPPILTTTGTFPGNTSSGYSSSYSYPKPYIINFTKEEDDDGNNILCISLDEKNKCEHKITLFPGIRFYTNQKQPGFFRRTILSILFGIKWESTLKDRFIEGL